MLVVFTIWGDSPGSFTVFTAATFFFFVSGPTTTLMAALLLKLSPFAGVVVVTKLQFVRECQSKPFQKFATIVLVTLKLASAIPSDGLAQIGQEFWQTHNRLNIFHRNLCDSHFRYVDLVLVNETPINETWIPWNDVKDVDSATSRVTLMMYIMGKCQDCDLQINLFGSHSPPTGAPNVGGRLLQANRRVLQGAEELACLCSVDDSVEDQASTQEEFSDGYSQDVQGLSFVNSFVDMEGFNPVECDSSSDTQQFPTIVLVDLDIGCSCSFFFVPSGSTTTLMAALLLLESSLLLAGVLIVVVVVIAADLLLSLSSIIGRYFLRTLLAL